MDQVKTDEETERNKTSWSTYLKNSKLLFIKILIIIKIIKVILTIKVIIIITMTK